MSAEVIKALVVAAELTQTELSKAALAILVQELAPYPEAAAVAAIRKAARRRPLTLGAILEHLEHVDGWPSADEAWSVALTAQDEASTVVWTGEIAEAWGVAKPILGARDAVGARKAFIEAYDRLVEAARDAGERARWLPSLGTDLERRALALERAVERGQLARDQIGQYLPAPIPADNPVLALLRGPGAEENARQHLDALRHLLTRRG